MNIASAVATGSTSANPDSTSIGIKVQELLASAIQEAQGQAKRYAADADLQQLQHCVTMIRVDNFPAGVIMITVTVTAKITAKSARKRN